MELVLLALVVIKTCSSSISSIGALLILMELTRFSLVWGGGFWLWFWEFLSKGEKGLIVSFGFL